MKTKKEKAISLRLSNELYQQCVEVAINKTIKENRLVNVSEIIRDILEKGLIK